MNSTRKIEDLGMKDWLVQHPDVEIFCVPASGFAEKHLGRPISNVGMVAGFASITGAITQSSVEHAIKEKFPGKIGELNANVANEAFHYISSHKVGV